MKEGLNPDCNSIGQQFMLTLTILSFIENIKKKKKNLKTKTKQKMGKKLLGCSNIILTTHKSKLLLM